MTSEKEFVMSFPVTVTMFLYALSIVVISNGFHGGFQLPH